LNMFSLVDETTNQSYVGEAYFQPEIRLAKPYVISARTRLSI
jgi:hypothetical protein